MAAQAESIESRFGRGANVAKASIGAMVVLTVVKGYVGVTYNSVALFADALNSLSDILASMLIWSGLVIASRPPNERFPYGYYRGESVAALLVALMIMWSGLEILQQALLRFLNPEPLIAAGPPLAAAFLSIVTYYTLAHYKRRVGREIGSSSLVADSAHSMVDVYAGILVFSGIVFSAVSLTIVEVVVALGLGAYIMAQGADIARGAVLALMDAGVRPEMVNEVRRIASQIDGVVDVHDIKLRYAGPVCFAEMHLTVTRNLSIEEAHEIADLVEERLREEIPNMETVTIHTEPDGIVKRRLAIPVEDNTGLDAQVSGHLSRAPFLLVIDVTPEEVCVIETLENPGRDLERKRGVAIANALAAEHVAAIVVREIGEGVFGILHGKHIIVYGLPEAVRTANEVLEAYRKGQLVRLRGPTERPT